MKLAWLTFALLLGMLAVFAGAWLVGPPADVPATASIHETQPSMTVGGPGAAKHHRVFGLGIAFGVLQIAFFAACLALGASRGGRVGRIAVPIAVGAALHILAFLGLAISYRAYAAEAGGPLFLGFPIPTAFLLYAVWWTPMVFVLIYVFAFDRYVFSDADHARFREILAARDARNGAGNGEAR
jgi:hypothetical protein